MTEVTLKRGRIKVDLKAFLIGEDLCVIISGGDRPHIGCVTTSVPRKSLSDPNKASATTSVINFVGHKDDEAARYVSHTLSAILNKNVVVTCGIHVDDISVDEIRETQDLLKEATDILVDKYKYKERMPVSEKQIGSEGVGEYIIAVDEEDNEVGFIEKMEAHRLGVLHRAFSIFVFNSKNQLLMQKRNRTKYHSPGLWTNTCCSHPRQGEMLQEAVYRRLQEEMGFTCDLRELFAFIYKVEFQKDLFEHELDHVFIGEYHGEVLPNLDEVEEYKWMKIEELQSDMRENPDKYTYWFTHIFDRVVRIRLSGEN